MFLPQEVILRKREGKTLSSDEIGSFIRGVTDNSVSEVRLQRWQWLSSFRA